MSADPDPEQPLLDTLLEDFMAQGSTAGDHAMLIRCWLLAGAQMMARTGGKRYALDSLANVGQIIVMSDGFKP